MIKPKILCTGAPRSGTSLFNLLMSYFKDLKVCTETGTPPNLFTTFDVFSTQQRPDGKLIQLKKLLKHLKKLKEQNMKIII